MPDVLDIGLPHFLSHRHLSTPEDLKHVSVPMSDNPFLWGARNPPTTLYMHFQRMTTEPCIAVGVGQRRKRY
jgi:hypothetical protein